MTSATASWLAAAGSEAGTVAVLLLAFLLGALVGIERGISTSAVGIRTCTLVSLAAAAYGWLMLEIVPPANWGAGFGAVATGVGFLGAGAIIKGGRYVKGLGDAATIWCVAMIGLLVGARQFVAALAVTLVVLTANVALRPVAAWIDRHRARQKPEDDVLDG
jgi:putative Mg2+ transporter-C (MgtC) family protein